MRAPRRCMRRPATGESIPPTAAAAACRRRNGRPPHPSTRSKPSRISPNRTRTWTVQSGLPGRLARRSGHYSGTDACGNLRRRHRNRLSARRTEPRTTLAGANLPEPRPPRCRAPPDRPAVAPAAGSWQSRHRGEALQNARRIAAPSSTRMRPDAWCTRAQRDRPRPIAHCRPGARRTSADGLVSGRFRCSGERRRRCARRQPIVRPSRWQSLHRSRDDKPGMHGGCLSSWRAAM